MVEKETEMETLNTLLILSAIGVGIAILTNIINWVHYRRAKKFLKDITELANGKGK